MSLVNGIGFLNHDATQPVQVGEASRLESEALSGYIPRGSPGVTIDIDTADTGTWTVSFPDIDHSITAAGSATDTVVAANIAAAINASTVFVGEATAAGSIVTLVFPPGLQTTVTVTVPGSGAITQANVAGGTAIPYGRFVVATGGATDVLGQRVALPGGSSTANQILGMVIRQPHVDARTASMAANATDAAPAGRAVAILRHGIGVVDPLGTTPTRGAAVHIGLGTNGTVAGAVYGAAVSTDTVWLPWARFWGERQGGLWEIRLGESSTEPA